MTTFPQCLPFPEHDQPRALPPSRTARPFAYDLRDNDDRRLPAEPVDEALARQTLPWLWVDPDDDQEAA